MAVDTSPAAVPESEYPPSYFLGIKLKPKPAGFAQGKTVPEERSSFLSQTLFSWLTPLLLVGFTRPLEIEDTWELPERHQATTLGLSLEHHFYSRVPFSKRPAHLQQRSDPPSNPPTSTAHDLSSSATSTSSTSSPVTIAEDAPSVSQPKAKSLDLDLEEGGEDLILMEEIAREKGIAGVGEPITIDKGKKKGKVKKGKDGRPGVAEEGGKFYDQSLLKALNRVVFWRFWSAGVFGIVGNLLTSFAPLVSQRLLTYIQNSYAFANGTSSTPPGSVGHGIGLAFALWIMQSFGAVIMQQFLQRGLVTGFLLRASLISAISRKSLRLDGEARAKHPSGQLITHISSDASFLDWAAVLAHDLWIQPISILVGLGILISLLGPSALVGFGVLLIGIPLQAFLFSVMIGTRKAQMKITDDRVRLLQEVLQGIRVIKLMAYESFFGDRIKEYRRQELKKLRINCIARASMTSVMALIPILAAVLSFITYSLSGHELSPAIIFSALQAFQNIRQPLFILPLAFQSLSDAYVGLGRISICLTASEIDNPIPVRPNAPYAVSAHGDFQWETNEKPDGATKGAEEKKGRAAKKDEKKKVKEAAKKKAAGEEEKDEGKEDVAPFALRNINLNVKRGDFVVVCGRVGSGKSSLIQALLGEMKMISGSAYMGGTTSYFPQNPWVQNATLRDNILFNDPNPDEARFNLAIDSCALRPDIAQLADGLETEIGERGINLSGGQKARVCLARAVYANSDIAILDDPLSAVDAPTAKTLVGCFTTGPLRNATRILVTHHLDVLPYADLIITMGDGSIAEMGTYSELLASDGALSRLVAEHSSNARSETQGSEKSEKGEEARLQDLAMEEDRKAQAVIDEETQQGGGLEGDPVSKPSEGALMLKEEREVGAVSGKVYGNYIRNMGGMWKAPLFLFALVCAQAANVGSTVFLGFWSGSELGWPQGRYMGVYAALGFSFSIFTFLGTFLLFWSGISASFNLFNQALSGVMRSPVNWHDRTPIGRIVSRLSKDITSLDDQLPMQWNQLLTMIMNVLGTIALVFYSFPYLGIIFVPMFFFYYCAAAFYRSTSREVKRLDSLMRSFIYASFGEMLTGLASVRAYRRGQQFILKTESAIDQQNRCYYLTVSIQAWLSIRLTFLGNLLVLGIALFGVGLRTSVSPSKLGVVLIYSLTLTQTFSQLVNIFSQVEQNMNTAERVQHYGNLEPEAATTTSEDPVPAWPERGTIEFDNVVFKYRPELPPVLKGASFKIAAGEKIGIVGRTGAGKSSLLQALFRIVELSSGRVLIDDADVSRIGLDALRSSLGIVPQDPLLWSGTVRSNLDPQGKHTDAELLSALRRCNLLPSDSASAEVKARLLKFDLSATVQDEGANFSAGERQLMALARVVVRNSRIIVLDEATSSVDVETDQSIQNTIKAEFGATTLLCIAHRLATVAYYDRIVVLEQGEVVEFDDPLALFDLNGGTGIFRSMCDKASLTREDIVKIRST